MNKTTYSLVLGIAGLLVIVGIFSGVISPYFIYGLSLLFAYAAARHGEAGYLVPGAALMLAGSLFFYGPSVGLAEIHLLALYGIFLGMNFYRRATPEMIYLPTLVLLFGVMLSVFYLQKVFLGVDGLEALLETYMEQVQLRITDADFIMTLRSVLREYSLSIIFLVALIFNLFLCWVFSKILDLRGLGRTGRFVFEGFRLRGLDLLRILALYVLVLMGSFLSKMPMQTALVSLSIVLLALFYLQGLSLLVYNLKTRGKSRLLIGVLVFFSLSMPFVQLFLAMMGLLDQQRDFRGLEKQK